MMTAVRKPGLPTGASPRPVIAALGWALFLVCAPLPGWVPGARGAPFLDMDRPEITLNLDYEWTDESVSGPSLARTEKIHLVRSGLRLSTRGSLYHRDFLRYTLRLQPEWHLQDATGTTSRKDRSGFFGYTLNAELLEKKLLGVALSTQQRRSEFSSSLSPTRVTRSSDHQASLKLRLPALPTSLTWGRDEVETENFYTARETSRTVRLESSYPGRGNTASLRLADLRQERRVNGSTVKVDAVQGALGGRLQLGEAYHLNASLVGNRSDSGLLDLRYLVGTTRLDARHAEHFHSHYQVQFNQRRSGGFRSESTTAEAGLEHRLFENLTTTATVRTTDNDQSIGRNRLHEGRVHFSYVRRIPWGQVGITHGQRLQRDDNGVTSPLTPVFDEGHILTGTTPSFLVHPNVDGTAPFQVTDLTGVIVYTAGIDYNLVTVGSTTGVVRDPAGGIASGQQVLVDYSYTSQLPYTVVRHTIHTGATLNLWQALRLYTALDTADISLRSGTMPSNIGNDHIALFGTEVRWRTSTTRVEFENRNTTVTPATRLVFRERVQFPVSKKSSGGIHAERVTSRYPGTGQWTTVQGLGGDLRRSLFDNGVLEVRASLKKTWGTLQRNHTRQLSALWTWRLGDWNGKLGLDVLRERDSLAAQTRSRDRIVAQAVRVF